jgi:hypothetical protein
MTGLKISACYLGISAPAGFKEQSAMASASSGDGIPRLRMRISSLASSTSWPLESYLWPGLLHFDLRDHGASEGAVASAEHVALDSQAAMEALLLVAEHDGPTMIARIGIMRVVVINAHSV